MILFVVLTSCEDFWARSLFQVIFVGLRIFSIGIFMFLGDFFVVLSDLSWCLSGVGLLRFFFSFDGDLFGLKRHVMSHKRMMMMMMM